MNQSVSVMLLGGLIRVLQGFAAAAPTLLVGLLIASILRYYLGGVGTRRLFGGESLRSLPQSWLVGMLLPVCSIGVLPILFEMRRAKVRPGAMSAFALSAPLFNPLSLLYGLTLSRPLVIILFALGSLVVVTALGLFWDAFSKWRRLPACDDNDRLEAYPTGDDRLEAYPTGDDRLEAYPTDDDRLEAYPTGDDRLEAYPTDDDRLEAYPTGDDRLEAYPTGDHLIGLRRVFATIVHLAREATGTSMLIALVALSGLALLAAILPYGAMQHEVERDDVWAPLKMLCVAVPVYATPMLAMSQMGMMFQHANSPGASFTLLILGAGMNLATPLWFGRHFGWKAAASWVASLLVIVLGISYAINKPLVPPGVEPAGHTHAFDIYTNPLTASHSFGLQSVVDTVAKDLDIRAVASLIALAIILTMGMLFRMLKIDEASLIKNAKAESFASSLRNNDATPRRGLDIVVPPNVIGATMLAGLVALSIVACYAYYPSPRECLAEISTARTECLSAANSGQVDHALYWLPVWEDWSRRLEVGTFLRTGQVRPYQRMQGYLIRKKLENLEHELEHDPFEPHETKQVVQDIMATNSRWTSSFRPPE
ncbi:putative permease [Novipirellula aureliae]|uniref:Putative permease n=1 Tax=Novipirellula aureliae TaxID=2527966 RepID=A0A5C6EF10_9BACT|nr:permease [Novipirellula aureliae]TWU45799.1 putative permease [Novipirellula aureliae]